MLNFHTIYYDDNSSEETAVEEEKNDVRQQLKNRPKPFTCDHITEENGVRFFNSSTESPPPVRTVRKRDHVSTVFNHVYSLLFLYILY